MTHEQLGQQSVVTTVADAPVSALDPLQDAESQAKAGTKRNFAKVGSARPSSLLYTYGPGSVMDLPHFTVMPAGLDDWDRIWSRRDGIPVIHAPRLLEVVRMMLGHQVKELRPFPWQGERQRFSREGSDLGVPARVFPQWLRCTGCDRLAPLSAFEYRNTHPYRPDEAVFEHVPCHGRRGTVAKRGRRARPGVPARYLLVCPAGHVDEFPYELWVHAGAPCGAGVDVPVLTMDDRTAGKGASAVITCQSCKARRGMNEAQGEAARAKLPRCRGRLPHLDGFAVDGCNAETRLMLVGASNLWFPAVQSVIDMPRLDPAEKRRDVADRVKAVLGERLSRYAGQLDVLRDLLETDGRVDVSALSDADLGGLVSLALAPVESDEDREERRRSWDPVDLLVPEWRYLQRDPLHDRHTDRASGLTLTRRSVSAGMPDEVTRVLAVDRLRKVNVLMGFTRIDDLDRITDIEGRLVPLTRTSKPEWAIANEDRGEGVFLQLDEEAVAAWEARVDETALWSAHREAHRRNFANRFSGTAERPDPDERFKPPRYWLVHTFAHVLLREMAMRSGYGAASLSERLYAWPGTDGRPPAAGLLICTTASDSDGTLGGLVALSEPERLAAIVSGALSRARRCSSDPLCAMRVPRDPEDFLHGAACHCCTMASETSCERANRFLDRRFLVQLPGSELGFFEVSDGW